MITFESIRAAVFSELPWSQLDDLVLAELAAGRSTAEIYSEMLVFADDVRKLPGLADDGQDAFGDTLDSLIGNCRSGQEYRDPMPAVAGNGDSKNLPRLPVSGTTAKLPSDR